MKVHTYKVIIITLSIINSLAARSSDVSNILLQPGGYYAFPFKDTLIDCYKPCDKNWYKTVTNQHSSFDAKKYYNNLAGCSHKKHFLFQALLYGCQADKGFNASHAKVPLSDLLFGGPLVLQEVNLASKLAVEGKLTLPTTPGMPRPYGSVPNEQYIALLAPTEIKISSEFQEVGLNLTGMYHVRIPGTKRLTGVLGLMVPIRSQLHRMNISYENGSLLSATVPPPTVPGKTTLTQFFSYFEGIDDFFTRGLLAPKELAFNMRQRRTNIGDVVMLTAFDASLCSEWLDAFLIGMQWVFPTGNKQRATEIWPIELGNGGSYQFEPFINLYANFCTWINPVLYAGGRYSTHYTGWRRIPQLKTGTGGELLADTTVLIPAGFENYIVTPGTSFSNFDTTRLQFADQRVAAKVHPGSQFLFRIGNFTEEFLIESLDLGIFYDLYLSGKEKIGVLDVGVFDTNLLTQNSDTTQHIISWRLGYTHDEVLQAYVGSQHVIAGKNVPQDNKLYASIAAYF